MIFSFQCLYFAKQYVRIPNIIYIYRQNFSSVTSSHISLENRIHRNIKVISRGIKELDKLFELDKSLNENLKYKYKYTIINFFIQQNVFGESEIYSKFPIHLIDTLLRKEFIKEIKEDGEVLMSAFFSLINIYTIQLKSLGKL